ncbi:MAG: GNAT family N-acetyltransferase [Pseudomonadota bacterium]
MTPRIAPIDPTDGAVQTALRALNNAHAAETSFLDHAAWGRLRDLAFAATHVPPAAGFMIAMAPDAAYDSPNYLWFRQGPADFAYVDRVVVDAAARGRGIARALYGDLAARARASGLRRIVCEVNSAPPNPGSDAFHERLGFQVVGTGSPAPGKTVRYYAKEI